MSDSLCPCGLQPTRLPCPSLSSRVCSNSCPLSQWCHPTVSSSVTPFFSYPQSSPASVFSNELALHIRWPKYWSFSFSPSNEYSRLISFRIDWFEFRSVQGETRVPCIYIEAISKWFPIQTVTESGLKPWPFDPQFTVFPAINNDTLGSWKLSYS